MLPFGYLSILLVGRDLNLKDMMVWQCSSWLGYLSIQSIINLPIMFILLFSMWNRRSRKDKELPGQNHCRKRRPRHIQSMGTRWKLPWPRHVKILGRFLPQGLRPHPNPSSLLQKAHQKRRIRRSSNRWGQSKFKKKLKKPPISKP